MEEDHAVHPLGSHDKKEIAEALFLVVRGHIPSKTSPPTSAPIEHRRVR